MSTATPAPAAATPTPTSAATNSRRNGMRPGFLPPPHAPHLHNNTVNGQLSMMMHGNDPDAAARASEDKETAIVVEPGLQVYWHSLALEHRKKLLKLSKKDLFSRIRTSCCSGCFGLFQMRYEELKNHLSGTCPVCHDCYAGLVITEDGGVTLGEKILGTNPFGTFNESRCREREREMHFMTGDICGSGWQKKPGQNKCKLHTSHVPYEALSEYWTGLPCEQQATLLVLSEEQFVSELDGQMKCQLRICKECRCNVMRAFKELKPGRDGVQLQPSLPLCPNHELKFCDGMVKVEGSGEPVFFEAAEEVEEHKTFDPSTGNDTDNPDTIRHAETPELAREALQDSALLIFKSQVEVSFREQTASQNALLLFVYLIHTLMELQLGNAYKELSARQAETELLLSLDLESAQAVARKEKKAAKRKNKKLAGIDEDLDEKAAADFLLGPPPEEIAPAPLLIPEEPPAPLSKAQRRLAHETASKAGKAAAPAAAPEPSLAAAVPVQEVKATAVSPASQTAAASPALQAAAAAAAVAAVAPSNAAGKAAGAAAAAAASKPLKGAAKRAAAAAAAEISDAAVAKALVTPRGGAEPAGPAAHEEISAPAASTAQANGHVKARPSTADIHAAPTTGRTKGAAQHAAPAPLAAETIPVAMAAVAAAATPAKGKQATQTAAASAQQLPHSHAVVNGPAAAPMASLAPAHNPHPQQSASHQHDKQQFLHQQQAPTAGNGAGKASAHQHPVTGTEQTHSGHQSHHTGQTGLATTIPLVMLQPVQEALQNTDKRQQVKQQAQQQQGSPAAAAAAAAALPMPTNAPKQPQHPTVAAIKPPGGRAPPPPHPYPTQAAANAPPAPPPPPTAPRHPPNNFAPTPAYPPAIAPNRQQAAAAASAALTAAQAAAAASQHAAAVTLAAQARGPPQPPAPLINSVEYPPLRSAAAPVLAGGRNQNHHPHAAPAAAQPVLVLPAPHSMAGLARDGHQTPAVHQDAIQRSSSMAQPVSAVPIPSASLLTVRSGPVSPIVESATATPARGPHAMGPSHPSQQQHQAPTANGMPTNPHPNQQAHLRPQQQQHYPSLAGPGPSPHPQQQQPDLLRHPGAPPHGKGAVAGLLHPHQAMPNGVIPARTIGGPLHHAALEAPTVHPSVVMPSFAPVHTPAPAAGQSQQQQQAAAGTGAPRPFAVPICRPPSSSNLLSQHQQQMASLVGGVHGLGGVGMAQMQQQHQQQQQPGYNALEVPRQRGEQQRQPQQQQTSGWLGLQSHAPPQSYQHQFGQQHQHQQQHNLASKMLAQQQLESNHPAVHLQHHTVLGQQQHNQHQQPHQQHHPQYQGLMPAQNFPPGDTTVLRALPANAMMAGNGQNGNMGGVKAPPFMYAQHAPPTMMPTHSPVPEANSFSFFSTFPPNYSQAGLGSRAGMDGNHVSNGGGSLLGGDRGSTHHHAGLVLDSLDMSLKWGTGAPAPVVASGKVNTPAAMGGGAYSLFGMAQNTAALFAER